MAGGVIALLMRLELATPGTSPTAALPTQGAANPALTITAEASRVAEVLDAKGPFRVARRRGARG